MPGLHRVACVLLVMALSVVLLANAGAAEPGLTRAQALKRLSDAEPAKRREATARLGEVGVMADGKALVAQLRDTDEGTRAAAEESLWQIWARSGDEKVDALYQQGLRQMEAGRGQDALAT